MPDNIVTVVAVINIVEICIGEVLMFNLSDSQEHFTHQLLGVMDVVSASKP